jgi:kumamolisin
MPQSTTIPGYCRLAGMHRLHHPDDRLGEAYDPASPVHVTLRLRSRDPQGLDATFRQYASEPHSTRTPAHLTPEEFESRFGSSAEDIAAIERFAQHHGLTVTNRSSARRSVAISGPSEKIVKAFKVNLLKCTHLGHGYRAVDGDVYVPETLRDIVVGVFGLDNRPQAHPHFRRLAHATNPHAAAAAADRSFDPTKVATLYKFPTNVTGRGETIGFIELGGGFQQSDLSSYFQKLGISPAPNVTAISVDSANNAPTGDPSSADGEVALDIEVTGAVAPGANIKVFFAPNSDQGFLDAITTAVHDTDTSLISISWGQAESGFAGQTMTAFNDAFKAATTLGKTVFAASGDNGSSDGVGDGANHVDFPASSPFAVGCGGTNINVSSDNSSIVSETVWNEETRSLGSTGGGVSNVFPLPDFQANARVPASANPQGGRGVPDVAGDADPASGYNVLVDGNSSVSGGTSAVAPLFAGLFALINQARVAQGLTRVGFIHPTIYQHPEAFNDITSGNNGAFQAGQGWDATTGLGSPNGTVLMQVFLSGA